MANEKQYRVFQTTAGAQLADSTTRTEITHTTGNLVLPPNTLEVGKRIIVRAAGSISCVVTTPGTLTLDLDLLNPTPAHVICAVTSAMGLNVVAKTTRAWFLEWILECTAIGATTTAKLRHQCRFTSEAVVGSALPTVGGNGTILSPVTAPVDGTGFDSTVQQTMGLFAQFSVATAGTNITCTQFTAVTDGP